MKGVELYGRVRYAVQIEGLSHREAARQFGIDPRTLASRAAEQENTSRQHHARVRPGCGELIIAASGIGSGVPG